MSAIDEPAAAVLAANRAFYEAFAALDIEAMAALWCRDGDALCVHPGWPPLRGWDAIRASWAGIFEGTERMEFVLAAEAVTIASDGEAAHVDLIENITSVNGERTTGGAIGARNGFVRRDGRWLLTSHVAVPD